MAALLAQADAPEISPCKARARYLTDGGWMTLICTGHQGNEHYDGAFCLTWKDYGTDS